MSDYLDFRHIDALDRPYTPPRPAPQKTTVVACAIGDPNIQPALCAVRYVVKLISPGDPMFGEEPIFQTDYQLLATHQLALGATYPQLAARVNRTAKILWDRDQSGDYHVLVDASGVGKPVVDAIRQSIVPQVHVTGVTVDATDRGDPSILWRNDARVGLSHLVSRLQAIVQGNRLHIPADESHLLGTLADFTLEHADRAYLVRALALCVASDYQPVVYDVHPDDLPAAAY